MLLVSSVLHDLPRKKTYPALAALAVTISSGLVSVAAPVLAQNDKAAEAAPAPSQARPALLPFKAPPGTRLIEGRYVVGSGLAEATRFVDRQLTRAGIAFTRVGPYRVRGLEVTRFLSESSSTPWLAIHLVRKGGRTFLDVVDRPASATARTTP